MDVDGPSCFPLPRICRNAVIGGLTSSVHPSGVGCFASNVELTHFRADTPDGITNRMEITPAGEPVASVKEALYGGPLFNHFGHVVAESIHRLWATHVFSHLADAPIVFQVHGEAPPTIWRDDLMRACGIDPGRLILASEPLRVETLHVPMQGRILAGPAMFPGYAALFPLAPIAPRDACPVYVSRSGHSHSGSYSGEEQIEAALRDAGFAILRPEATPLPELLSALRAAPVIIFCEGSAIHNLEMIGRVDAQILVIARRYGAKNRFGPLLGQLARSVDFYTRIEPAFPLARLSVPHLLSWLQERVGLPIAA